MGLKIKIHIYLFICFAYKTYGQTSNAEGKNS